MARSVIYHVTRAYAANQPELGAELARRTKELAALKSQRM